MVAAGEILEHVPDLAAVVAEACRLLRPGGLLVLDTLNDTALARLVAVTVGERLPAAPPGHPRPARCSCDARALVAECARHGVALRCGASGRRRRAAALAAAPVRDRTRGATARAIVPTWSTAVLYQGRGPQGRAVARHGTPRRRRMTVHALDGGPPAGAAVRRAGGRARPGRLLPGRRLRRPAGGRAVRADGARSGWAALGAGFADYAAVAYELARGNGATALVFNMHASVTGALGGITDELADALGVPDEALAARDRSSRAAAEGAWYAVAMSERGAGSRLSQLTTAYEPVDGGFHIKGSKTFCSGAGHADGYLVAARSAGRPVAWCRSSWCRPATG